VLPKIEIKHLKTLCSPRHFHNTCERFPMRIS